MKKMADKNCLVTFECMNVIGMPVRYKKKMSYGEVAEFRTDKSHRILGIKQK